MPVRRMVNESAPRSETMASDTAPFTPWIRATTAMIDDTATMLPSRVRSERSLLDQIESSASFTASQSCDMAQGAAAAGGGGASRTSSAS